MLQRWIQKLQTQFRTQNHPPKIPPRSKPRKSLRSLLTFWFLIFSIAPLAFVTGYSLIHFENAMNQELFKRLRGNAREISVVLKELEQSLQRSALIHARDPSLTYLMTTASFSQGRRHLEGWLRPSGLSRLSLFDREGRLVVAIQKDGPQKIQNLTNLESGDVFLSESILTKLSVDNTLQIRDISNKRGLELIVYAPIYSKNKKLVGFIEEIIALDLGFFRTLKNRLNIDIVLFEKELKPLFSTNEDFSLFPKNYFRSQMTDQKDTYFDLVSRDLPYGFLMTTFRANDSEVTLGLATNKQEVQTVIKSINRALFTILSIVILLLIVCLVNVSNIILKPLQELVEATQKIEMGRMGYQIPLNSQTEIGLLTESFNRMSRQVASAQTEFQNKVQELEETNQELQNTQSQLVQSAKLVSLGQLVAGIAHELNNPISFIFSNMSHLKDYTQRLEALVDLASSNIKDLPAKKTEFEYEYIRKDLPKLIKSCEDGARRVRDIVLGLRNFSRIDEQQLKEYDVISGIKDTLALLSGELKNRIEIETKFDQIPIMQCYPTQMNQVFMNLLSNAAQSIHDHGKIKITTSVENKNALIKIEDTGSGIAPEALDKIFDPFFTTKPVGQGTGLGLSISYGIVQRHGGQITVESKQGEGTQFTVILPLEPSHKATA